MSRVQPNRNLKDIEFGFSFNHLEGEQSSGEDGTCNEVRLGNFQNRNQTGAAAAVLIWWEVIKEIALASNVRDSRAIKRENCHYFKATS